MQMILNRRSLIQGAAALTVPAAVTPSWASARIRPKIALTIDDFAMPSTNMLSILDRDKGIRATLDRHNLKAAGFVAGMRVDNPDGHAILKAWSDSGHIFGNHSYSHKYFGKQSIDSYWTDIAKCDALLTPYKGFRKLFRFPYLGEGTSPENRDAMRQKLKDNGYRNGVVTIDTSEWFIDNRMGKRYRDNVQAKLDGYGHYYVAHLLDRAEYYDRLSRLIFKQPIPHTLLIHHNDVTALFLHDVITMFKDKGWEFINAEDAYHSDELQQTYDVMPSGQSIIWAAAKAKAIGGDLRYPAEDGRYEEPKMLALGL
jgi:peptidoglycan-N-acetylglucosamine deacetylase